VELLERIRRRVQVSAGTVQIDRGVREVGVAEEQLNGPQIGAGLE
jgi:hypothetical protein